MARDAIEQIEMTLRLIESYPDVFELAREPQDVKKIYAQSKIACSIGIEGCVSWSFAMPRKLLIHRSLHMAGNSIGIIRAFYLLGVRYVSPEPSFGVFHRH
jgi:membrane dipeptidase